MLTRISPEKIRDIVKSCEYPIFKPGQEPDGEVAFMALNSNRLHTEIADAQLEADQKVIDAITAPPELLETTIQLRIEEKVKEIFGEIENTGWYKNLPHVKASVQALKERMGMK